MSEHGIGSNGDSRFFGALSPRNRGVEGKFEIGSVRPHLHLATRPDQDEGAISGKSLAGLEKIFLFGFLVVDGSFG